MDVFEILVITVCFILLVILFFKIWGMTNNVRKIADILSENQKKEYPTVDEEVWDGKFAIGSHVVDKKNGKQMRVTSINDGVYVCLPIGSVYPKNYNEDDIELFSVYVESLKK